ncbi:MAG: glycoside hydrolase family 1 protein [Culicoidibacterales bacterium]
MMKYTFPHNFYWGSATSAPQSEGHLPDDGKGQNIWDYWFEENPELFFDQVGPQTTSTFAKNYREDLRLLRSIGLNSLRLSISWSRLFPEGTGEINEQAVAFYRDIFTTMHEVGIEPFVNLFHFDLPLPLQNLGGWENRHVVSAFATYASTCFSLFGDLVAHWFTFNEPIVIVECGYLYQFHYPAVVDSKRAAQVGYHLALAHACAVAAFRSGKFPGEIGIIVNLSPIYPKDLSPEHKQAALIADCFFNRSFLDPALKGTFPQPLVDLLQAHDALPNYTEHDLAIIAENTVDILGVNYYQPRRVQAPTHQPEQLMPETYFAHYEWPERIMNPYRGWEIYPQGLFDLAIRLKNDYGNPRWYVAENGMGVENEQRFLDETGQIQDTYRIQFFHDHLSALASALESGANCVGYHVWTGIDNWSWLNAYKNRYGLIALDLATQTRTVKRSGLWFKALVETNVLPDVE